MVALERRLRGQRIDELEARCRPEGHGERDRAVELHDGGWCDIGESLVERRDARPVRLLRETRPRVAGGDRSLERVGAERAAELLGTLERRETTADEEVVPA